MFCGRTIAELGIVDASQAPHCRSCSSWVCNHCGGESSASKHCVACWAEGKVKIAADADATDGQVSDLIYCLLNIADTLYPR